MHPLMQSSLLILFFFLNFFYRCSLVDLWWSHFKSVNVKLSIYLYLYVYLPKDRSYILLSLHLFILLSFHLPIYLFSYLSRTASSASRCSQVREDFEHYQTVQTQLFETSRTFRGHGGNHIFTGKPIKPRLKSIFHINNQ